MLQFSYEAKDSGGKFIKGTIEAFSEDGAVGALHQKGLVILSLVQAQDNLLKSDVLSVLSKPSRKEVVFFTRQLSTIIAADIPLLEGLETIVANRKTLFC